MIVDLHVKAMVIPKKKKHDWEGRNLLVAGHSSDIVISDVKIQKAV